MIESMHEGVWAAIAIAALSIVLGLVGESDYQDALDEEALYCQQTLLFKRTNGQSGWPDYRQSAKELCE